MIPYIAYTLSANIPSPRDYCTKISTWFLTNDLSDNQGQQICDADTSFSLEALGHCMTNTLTRRSRVTKCNVFNDKYTKTSLMYHIYEKTIIYHPCTYIALQVIDNSSNVHHFIYYDFPQHVMYSSMGYT